MQFQSKMRRYLNNETFMPVKTFETAPRLLKQFDRPWSDVSIRALIQVDIYCAFVVNCDLINNNNSNVIKLRTCMCWTSCKKYHIINLFII